MSNATVVLTFLTGLIVVELVRSVTETRQRLRVDPYLAVAFEVPESGDDLKAVFDGVAAATALTKDLPVFEPGDDMFDAGMNAAVVSPAVVAGDAAGFVAARRGDRWMPR
jgi:hypothetical protein